MVISKILSCVATRLIYTQGRQDPLACLRNKTGGDSLSHQAKGEGRGEGESCQRRCGRWTVLRPTTPNQKLPRQRYSTKFTTKVRTSRKDVRRPACPLCERIENFRLWVSCLQRSSPLRLLLPSGRPDESCDTF